MDRLLVFPGQIPLDSDLLNTQRNAMISDGYLMEALLGANTVVDGLACTPTAPASMTVNVGRGAIYGLQTVDQSSFGSLVADSTDPIFKAGINLTATPFTLTAPGTSGQSINYLIQATFQESDNTPVTLPYFNSGNPASPFSGPSNSGVPQNTVRAQRVQLQLKAGTPANTGTQATPAVDAGWTGIWVIAVNFGQTTITSGAISTYPNAPFLAAHLEQHHKGIPGQAPKIDLATEVQGLLPLANMTQVRKALFSNTTIFVNPTTGNDSNDGLTTGTAFRTIQAAINAVYTVYDWNGHVPTIKLADGTYSVNAGGNGYAANFTGMPLGCIGFMNLTGNTISPGNVIVSVTNGNGIGAQIGALLNVSGLTLTASGAGNGFSAAGGYGVISSNGSYVSLGNLTVGSCGVAQLRCQSGGIIAGGVSTITLTGATGAAIQIDSGTLSWWVGQTFNVTGLTCSIAFAHAVNCSVITLLSNTFVGSATGPRYSVSTNSVINVGGGGATYLPGNSAGAAATGGQYN